MEQALGAAYASSWAELQVLGSLGGRTVVEALDEGESPRQVWAAVHERLGLPASQR